MNDDETKWNKWKNSIAQKMDKIRLKWIRIRTIRENLTHTHAPQDRIHLWNARNCINFYQFRFYAYQTIRRKKFRVHSCLYFAAHFFPPIKYNAAGILKTLLFSVSQYVAKKKYLRKKTKSKNNNKQNANAINAVRTRYKIAMTFLTSAI